MQAELVSVNVGLPRPAPYQGRLITTGIFKQSAPGRVVLRSTQLDGDGQADLINHGGVDKAVYAYDRGMYDFWSRQLDRDDFTPGQFGENFTTTGMPDEDVFVGDVYGVGGAVVQVTQPRAPCVKLGLRMGDATFVKRFLQDCRVGYYLRVLTEGEVGRGDVFIRRRRDPHGLPVQTICRLRFFDHKNVGLIEQTLQIEALSSAWRGPLEALL